MNAAGWQRLIDCAPVADEQFDLCLEPADPENRNRESACVLKSALTSPNIGSGLKGKKCISANVLWGGVTG